ncbi:MAG: S-methyl-5'-thioinosine phosphorylase [Gammaproteobacteria bacterium]
MRALIGGTGLDSLDGLEIVERRGVTTRWGEPSSELAFGRIGGRDLVFLARHGGGHTLPPHRVNYRANIQALKDVGVTEVVAATAVGGIAAFAGPGALLIPDQIIDYTWGRAHTFADGADLPLLHVDFTEPYCAELRTQLLEAARHADIAVHDGGCYGATQGPRLESAAEVVRLERDGCDLVGMTGMPEAALAREAGLCYAGVSVVANWAAGKADGEITMADIERELATGMVGLRALITRWLAG